MSIKNHYQTLFAFHWDTNQRMLDGAAHLDEADLQASHAYGRSSIHDLLFHILNADRSWRMALESGVQSEFLPPEDYPGLAELVSGFAAERDAWQVLLEALSADEIEADCELTSRRGRIVTFPRWRVLQHLILHGMQHHTELAQLLTQHGQSPGDIDFIFFRG